ncbi:hypothetical protein ACS3UN_07770 [Oscillospiraceae bacterium LTW-04]|nr:hypothetical protein RBH76_02575 [Oscillospiraceae bacterium MB24-C1]
MSQRSNLFALIILVSMLLPGCKGEITSSYIQPNTSQESSSQKQEQIENPYM